MELINQKIKELYASKALFCRSQDIDYTTHARLQKKFGRWIETINKYLKPLGLECVVKTKTN